MGVYKRGKHIEATMCKQSKMIAAHNVGGKRSRVAFTLRLPPALATRLARNAEQTGVSLNTYILGNLTDDA